MTASKPSPQGPARRAPTPFAVEAGWETGPAAPTEQEMAEQGAILAAEIAAGIYDQPPEDEFAALLADPDSGPPEGADAWLAELASPARDALLDAQAAAAGPEPEGPFPAAVLVHDGFGPGGSGFANGSVLDRLEPGLVLAAALDDTWQAGLAGLSDDELAGLVLGWRRTESRAAAGMLAGIAELARRRAEHGDSRVLEHTDSELALLLTLTRRAAGSLLDFATSLARLPATQAALAAGRIDRARADVIAYETAFLDDALAAAVEQLVIKDAARLTTSGLRARLRRAVIAADPAAARRRADQAARDARVEFYAERSSDTAALAGRDLPVAGALAADQRIDTAAKTLKASGIPATLPQLRAAVFLGLLTGQDPLTFLPPPEPASGEGAEQRPADHEHRPGAPTRQSDPDPGASPGQGSGVPPAPASPDGSGRPGQHPASPPAPADPDGSTSPDQSPGAAPAPADPDDSASPDQCSGSPPAPADPAIAPDSSGAPGRAPRWGLRGSVHLTMPLAAWLGLTRISWRDHRVRPGHRRDLP